MEPQKVLYEDVCLGSKNWITHAATEHRSETFSINKIESKSQSYLDLDFS